MTGQPVKWAEIDTDALRANAASMVAYLGESTALMGMVKANGYGHGATTAAGAFLEGGATWLGVSSPEEAFQLRAAGIDAPVLNVNWTHPTHLRAMVAAGVQMAVFDAGSVDRIAEVAAAANLVASVHLKVDTGMNRLGARPEHLDAVVAALRRAGRRIRIAGVFTHFADADGVDLSFTEQQLGRFDAVLPGLLDLAPDAVVHAANTAAALRLRHTHHDLVRVGMGLYGYPPGHCEGIVGVRPALSMRACVTHVTTVLPGETAGYGRTWTAGARTRVAVIGAGYADGVFRAQSNRGAVLLGDVRCPMIGRISMDQTTIDVSAVPGVVPGDEATLIGGRGTAAISAEDVAEAAGTIAYEVLCSVSPRVPRVVRVAASGPPE